MIQIEVPTAGIDTFCRKWHVKELALFGSVLRKNFRPESDIDVLISFRDSFHWSLFDGVDMTGKLKDIFERDVGLVSQECLRNPFRREAILKTREILHVA